MSWPEVAKFDGKVNNFYSDMQICFCLKMTVTINLSVFETAYRHYQNAVGAAVGVIAGGCQHHQE